MWAPWPLGAHLSPATILGHVFLCSLFSPGISLRASQWPNHFHGRLWPHVRCCLKPTLSLWQVPAVSLVFPTLSSSGVLPSNLLTPCPPYPYRTVLPFPWSPLLDRLSPCCERATSLRHFHFFRRSLCSAHVFRSGISVPCLIYPRPPSSRPSFARPPVPVSRRPPASSLPPTSRPPSAMPPCSPRLTPSAKSAKAGAHSPPSKRPGPEDPSVHPEKRSRSSPH